MISNESLLVFAKVLLAATLVAFVGVMLLVRAACSGIAGLARDSVNDDR